VFWPQRLKDHLAANMGDAYGDVPRGLDPKSPSPMRGQATWEQFQSTEGLHDTYKT
jgi:hypothetical protein